MTARQTFWYVYARKAFDTRAPFRSVGRFNTRPMAVKEAEAQRKQGMETIIRKEETR